MTGAAGAVWPWHGVERARLSSGPGARVQQTRLPGLAGERTKGRAMTPEQALREARDRQLRPVYLVIGEDHHRASAVVKALREAALEGGTPGLNDDAMVAGEASVDAVLAAARTLPMLARRRLVLVRSLERWEEKSEASGKTNDKGASAPLDRIADYAKDPAPSTVLILVAGKLDSRRRLVTAAKKADFCVSCEPLGRNELAPWIERAVRERGNTIEPGVADFILELSGPELALVEDAVERLCLFVGEKAAVTEDAVAECLVRLRPTTVWELVGAVGRRDVGAALAALESVYDPQDRGLRLLGVLAWSTRQLLKFESAIRAGHPPQEATRLAGAPPFKARELGDQVRRIPRPELERWLESLSSVDLALKGGSKRQPLAVLEHAIIGLCGASARRDRPSNAKAAR
jgi:DNA polymerase III subunit delta